MEYKSSKNNRKTNKRSKKSKDIEKDTEIVPKDKMSKKTLSKLTHADRKNNVYKRNHMIIEMYYYGHLGNYDRRFVAYLVETTINNVNGNEKIMKVGYTRMIYARLKSLELFTGAKFKVVSLREIEDSSSEKKFHKYMKKNYSDLIYPKKYFLDSFLKTYNKMLKKIGRTLEKDHPLYHDDIVGVLQSELFYDSKDDILLKCFNKMEGSKKLNKYYENSIDNIKNMLKPIETTIRNSELDQKSAIKKFTKKLDKIKKYTENSNIFLKKIYNLIDDYSIVEYEAKEKDKLIRKIMQSISGTILRQNTIDSIHKAHHTLINKINKDYGKLENYISNEKLKLFNKI